MASTGKALVLYAALLAQQAAAQTGLGCSWVTPTMPAIPSPTVHNGSSDLVLSTSEWPQTTTVIAEASVTVFRVCNGTMISSYPGTPAIGTVSSTVATSQMMTTKRPNSSTTAIGLSASPAPATSSALSETSNTLAQTASSTTEQVIKPSAEKSSATPRTTLEILTSRPISDVPNLPSSLPAGSSKSVPTSTAAQLPSMAVSEHQSSSPGIRPQSSTPEKSDPAASASSQTTPKSELGWTKTSTILATNSNTVQVPVSTAQPLHISSATCKTITAPPPPYSADDSHTTTPLATQTVNIVSQLPDGQIQAGSLNTAGFPIGTITSDPYSDVAEHPPYWTPGPTTSTSICSIGTRTFECANSTAIPSKFRTERTSKVEGPSHKPCSTDSVILN